tara:strand:+ start:2587 stop:2751 length:165 start_codon:yes stop_codon:yes gene_type:complete
VKIATTLKAGLSYGQLLHANAAARIFTSTPISPTQSKPTKIGNIPILLSSVHEI